MRSTIALLLSCILIAQLLILGFQLFDHYTSATTPPQESQAEVDESSTTLKLADSATNLRHRKSTASNGQGSVIDRDANKPIQTHLMFDASGISLKGMAPNRDAIDQIVAMGKQLYPTRSELHDSAQPAKQWLPSIAAIIHTLPQFQKLDVKMNGQQLEIRGIAKHTGSTVALAAALQRLPHKMYSDINISVNKAVHQQPKKATPPTKLSTAKSNAKESKIASVHKGKIERHTDKDLRPVPPIKTTVQPSKSFPPPGGEIYWRNTRQQMHPFESEQLDDADTQITFNDVDKRIHVSGRIPNEQAKARLEQSVAALDYQIDFSDSRIVSRRAPNYWSNLMGTLVKQAPKFTQMHARLSDDVLKINGDIKRAGESAIVLALLQRTHRKLKVQACFRAPVNYMAASVNCTQRINELLRNERIQFEENSSKLHWSSYPILDTLSEMLKHCPSASLQLSWAQMSATIGAQNNKPLSASRTQAISAYLLEKGLVRHKILADASMVKTQQLRTKEDG